MHSFFQYASLIFTLGFFICVGLYIYFMSQRMRKNAPVDFKLWLLVAIGLLLNIGAQLSELGAGQATWNAIKLNVLVTCIFVVYAVWRVVKIKKQPIQPDKPGPNSGQRSKTKERPSQQSAATGKNTAKNKSKKKK